MSDIGSLKASAERHGGRLVDAVDNLRAYLEEAYLEEAHQFKEGDYVKGDVNVPPYYTATIRGYFAGGDIAPRWGLIMIKQDGKWRRISAFNLEPSGKGNAKDRRAAMRALASLRRREDEDLPSGRKRRARHTKR